MRFPHDVILYPAVADEDGSRWPDYENGRTAKAFILPKTTDEVLSQSRDEIGQRSTITFTMFIPPTVTPFDAWAALDWVSTKPWQGGRFEVQGQPLPFGGTKGTVHHVQLSIKQVT